MKALVYILFVCVMTKYKNKPDAHKVCILTDELPLEAHLGHFPVNLSPTEPFLSLRSATCSAQSKTTASSVCLVYIQNLKLQKIKFTPQNKSKPFTPLRTVVTQTDLNLHINLTFYAHKALILDNIPLQYFNLWYEFEKV